VSPSRLDVRGGFSVLQRFTIDPEQGRRFVAASRDDNPIHIDGGIVPGAMTAARLVLLPEILLDGFVGERLKVKFRAIAHYGRPTLHHFRISPRPKSDSTDPTAFDISLEAVQDGETVASGVISGTCHSSFGDAPPRSHRDELATPSSNEDSCCVDDVRGFLASLSIDPDAYLANAGYAYPRAFLASLPSGEMVRTLSGEGGLLNSLSLDFTGVGAPPLVPGAAPSVEVEKGRKRRGSAFRKVMTRVLQGVQIHCHGFAMVFFVDEEPSVA